MLRLRPRRDSARGSLRVTAWKPSAHVLTAAALTALAFLPAFGLTPLGHGPSAHADDLTASLDSLRTGWDPNEPGLSPSVVAGGTFGRVYSTAVNGQVYAQPLVVGSTLIVATENDWVYGLNAATGAVKWSESLGTPYAISYCSDLVPNIGITSAPVYDSANGNVYVAAQVMSTTSSPYPTYRIFGISAATGAISLNKLISGSPANDPNIKFSAKYENQRAGLLLMNGYVYAAFAGHCDHQPYTGYVVGVNVATGAKTMWTDEAGITYSQAGIWQAGGGLMSDGSGRLFFTSGNGISPAPGPGSAPPSALAESTVRLSAQPGKPLAAQDFFSPANAPALDSADTDFGAGGPAGLRFGTTAYPHLLVQAGKDGRVFLLNRDNLGGRQQGPGGTDAVVATAGPYAGQWGHPATFSDTASLTAANASAAHDYIYYSGKYDYLRFLKAGVDSTDTPSLQDVANSSLTFGFTSGSPVVTSNGTDPSSAVLWEVRASGATGSYGTLYAFTAVPASTCTAAAPCTMAPIWSAKIGNASKFTIPATSNGMVYVGTRDGTVLGFGVLPAAAPLAGAKPLSLGNTALNSTSTKEVTLTASSQVAVSGVSASSGPASTGFSVGKVTESGQGGGRRAVTFPVTLAKGDQLHAQVTFTPAAPGGAADTLSFATDSARFPSVTVPLYGNGTQPGLYTATTSIPFHIVQQDGAAITNVPVGIALSQTVSIVNGGTTPEKIATVHGPSGAFSATGLPKPGVTLYPGQPITVQVTFKPQSAGPATSSLSLQATQGKSISVGMSGTGLPAVSQFTASPRAVDFGSVQVGHTVKAWIYITNTGNQPALMLGAARLSGPFHAPAGITRNLPVNSGYGLRIPVTFTPAGRGHFSGAYRLSWANDSITYTIDIVLSGTAKR